MSETQEQPDTQDATLKAWGTYLLHAVPSKGPNCAECIAARVPSTGCPEGQRLYAEYRACKSSNTDRMTAVSRVPA